MEYILLMLLFLLFLVSARLLKIILIVGIFAAIVYQLYMYQFLDKIPKLVWDNTEYITSFRNLLMKFYK